LCRPKGLLAKGKIKGKRNSEFSFSEGLTLPSLSLCRPKGLLAKGKIKGKRNSGFSFPEGLTPPSLLLCRPTGFKVSELSQPSKPSQPSKLSKPSKLSQPSQPPQPYFLHSFLTKSLSFFAWFENSGAVRWKTGFMNT